MRALGIISDKKIIEYCLLDIDNMESYMEYFIPSVHDSGQILTKQSALEYMASFTKSKTVHQVLEILSDYFLAHVGENNYTIKAYFLGYMVNKLLRVVSKVEQPTDRDHFMYKRIELSGDLISQLFNEYYTLQIKHIFKKIDEEWKVAWMQRSSGQSLSLIHI